MPRRLRPRIDLRLWLVALILSVTAQTPFAIGQRQNVYPTPLHITKQKPKPGVTNKAVVLPGDANATDVKDAITHTTGLPTLLRQRISADDSSIYVVTLRNHTPKYVQAAVRYRRLDGKWATVGWCHLEPLDTMRVAATDNRLIYIYAETIAPRNERVYWSGKDRFYKIRDSNDQYGFRRHRTDSGETSFSVTFTE